MAPVKVVPSLEPLALRAISPRSLSEGERVRIADLVAHGADRRQSDGC